MSYQDLIKDISKKADVTQEQARKVLSATSAIIEENLIANKETYIPKIGKFYPFYRQAMTVEHPTTREKVEIKHGFNVKFQAAINLKNAADI